MKAFAIALGSLCVTTAFALPTATITLASPQNTQTVAPGAQINWTLSVLVSSGDNAGLALVSVDIEQAGTNPEKLDIPQAPLPTTGPMTQFSRPDGISNPGEGANPTSGYGGVQRGTAGQRQLRQVGGAQNTFGAAGGSIGLDFNPQGGIAQGAAQVVASGSFNAPATEGVYQFSAVNPLVNVIQQLNTPPTFSPVVAVATGDINLSSASFTFTVEAPSGCTGDMNCDGTRNFGDIDPFVLALQGQAAYNAQFPGCNWLNGDTNGDNTVNFGDIDPFVSLLGAGACP